MTASQTEITHAWRFHERQMLVYADVESLALSFLDDEREERMRRQLGASDDDWDETPERFTVDGIEYRRGSRHVRPMIELIDDSESGDAYAVMRYDLPPPTDDELDMWVRHRLPVPCLERIS